MADRWRYFAQRFDGSGNLGEFVDLDLPLQNVEIEDVLSGHNSLTATISPEIARLKGSDGRPVFDEWGACLWAESPNGEVFGGILDQSGFSGPQWQLNTVDLSGAFIGTPFDDATFFVDVDPLDIFRYLWRWYQARAGCNLGVDVDATRSPVRLGGDLVQVQEFDQEADDPIIAPEELYPSPYPDKATWIEKAKKKLHKRFGWSGTSIENALNKWFNSDGLTFFTDLELKIIRKALKILGQPPELPPTNTNPTPTIEVKTYEYDAYKLNWYTNHDLSSDIDDLAARTPFDWHLYHYWSDDGDEADLFHRIRTGYPKLGRRATDLRFVVGENIHEIPNIDRDGEEYANEVIVFGSGEGSAMINARAFRSHPGRLRRTAVVSDTTLNTVAKCRARAELELAKRTQLEDITEVKVMDHPHAPLGSVSLGDEILIEGETGWADLSVWVRVLARRFAPDESDTMTLTVLRTDRLS